MPDACLDTSLHTPPFVRQMTGLPASVIFNTASVAAISGNTESRTLSSLHVESRMASAGEVRKHQNTEHHSLPQTAEGFLLVFIGISARL